MTEYIHTNIHEWIEALLIERVKSKRHEFSTVTNDDGKTRFKVQDQTGKYPYHWVKIGNEIVPQKWATRLLFDLPYPDKLMFHQLLSKNLFELLGFETGAFPE